MDASKLFLNEDEEDIFKPRKNVSESKLARKARKTHIAVQRKTSNHAHLKNPCQPSNGEAVAPEISSLASVHSSPEKTVHRTNIDTCWCPICQVPFILLKISAEMHTAQCDIPDDLPECPHGTNCESDIIFHYRDFSHRQLAADRDKEDYEPPKLKTPKKTHRTPRKRSTCKKRPSLSPASNPQKISKPLSDDIKNNEDNESRKRLFSEEIERCLQEYERTEEISNRVTNVADESSVRNNGPTSKSIGVEPPFVWPNEVNVKTERVDPSSEDDLFPLHSEMNLKSEEMSVQNESTVGCKNDSVPPGHQLRASLALNYDFLSTSPKQVVCSNKTACNAACEMQTEDSETLQAFCSITIKSSGIRPHAATVVSPITLNLEMSNSGWEALSIKGRSSAFVKDVSISLCECQKSLCVTCSVKDSNREAHNQIHEEKLAFTLKELGLKEPGAQPVIESSQEQSHQVSISTSSMHYYDFPCKVESDIPVGVSDDSSRLPAPSDTDHSRLDDTPTSCNGVRSEYSCSSETSKSSSPAIAIGSKSATFLQRKNGGTSRPSTPTPFQMVASRSSPSSWTLHPAVGVRPWQGSSGKKLPAYKRIPDTPFVVDAFSYGVIPGVKIYFLSHFHSDHYLGLRKGFRQPIFCSQVTANLVHSKLGVENESLHVLKIGEPRTVLGVEVEIFDANHCPGAIMFLFRLVDGRTFLHVGDFRAHESMEQYPQLRGVDRLYLDTTYCDPMYNFPPQDEVIDKVIKTVHHHIKQNTSTLFVCGSYTIGKEKVFKSIAEVLSCKIWATAEKVRVLRCLEDKILMSYLTNDSLQAKVHVLSMKDIAFEGLQEYLKKFSPRYSQIVAFKPTGWTTSTSLKGSVTDFHRVSKGKVTIYGVPYSEHSSFSELRRFVRFIRPSDIQVTVNVGKSGQYKKLFQQWLSNSSETNGQSSMLKFLSRERV